MGVVKNCSGMKNDFKMENLTALRNDHMKICNVSRLIVSLIAIGY